MAAVRMVRAVLPDMLQRGRGTILNTGSLNARLPDPLVLDYSAAKAALVNMAKALSKEVGPKGVRVVTVDPGPVATDLWLGQGGVASRVAEATGQSAEAIESGAAAGMVHRTVHASRRGGEPVGDAGLGPRREPDRRRHRDRRRHGHDASLRRTEIVRWLSVFWRSRSVRDGGLRSLRPLARTDPASECLGRELVDALERLGRHGPGWHLGHGRPTTSRPTTSGQRSPSCGHPGLLNRLVGHEIVTIAVQRPAQPHWNPAVVRPHAQAAARQD